MTPEEKLQIIDEKIESLKSVIGHVVLRTPETGINYDDPVEMEMVNQWVSETQASIAFLSQLKLDVIAGNTTI